MMVSLQEIITRGRFIFANAPGRLKVFQLINGKRTSKDIGVLLERPLQNVSRDIGFLRDAGLIVQSVDDQGKFIKVRGAILYNKLSLAKTIPERYFRDLSGLPRNEEKVKSPRNSTSSQSLRPLQFPSESQILEICREGEDQLYEFKGSGTEPKKIVREIAAMLNTTKGGQIFYGVDDDGTIQGSDVSRQKMDQPLQNSLRSLIAPSATIELRGVIVLGAQLLVITVPPWNKKDIYHFERRVLIRKGTNVFQATPEESKSLHNGKAII